MSRAAVGLGWQAHPVPHDLAIPPRVSAGLPSPIPVRWSRSSNRVAYQVRAGYWERLPGTGTGKFVANFELVYGVSIKQANFYKIFARCARRQICYQIWSNPRLGQSVGRGGCTLQTTLRGTVEIAKGRRAENPLSAETLVMHSWITTHPVL